MSEEPEATGWANPATAKQYAEFCQKHEMYWSTSRDLVALADVAGDMSVVDLACGTGVTTTCILEALGPDGVVCSVDGSPAMLAEAKRFVDDQRVSWVEARAEELDTHVADADVVVCNSAIWQTDMAATFNAIANTLKPGGRFACNIGRQFIQMPFTEEELNPTGPSLFDLMNAYAVIDHGHVSRVIGRGRGPDAPLSAERVTGLLESSGLRLEAAQEFSYDEETLERVHDWLSIPIFTERMFPGLSYEQRMDALAKAYARVEQAPPGPSRWMAFLATRPDDTPRVISGAGGDGATR